MRILVLGATGATGREVVAQALDMGHEVTALVRQPAKLPGERDRLRVVAGSIPENVDALATAVRGQDAVISALGVGNSLKSGGLFTRSVPAIVATMQREGVRRLILTSAYGVGATRRDVPLLPRILIRVLLSDLYADKQAGENVLRGSALDWTVVYPVTLTNGPKTGRYRTGERLSLSGLPRIARADVATCLLAQLTDRSGVGKGLLVAP